MFSANAHFRSFSEVVTTCKLELTQKVACNIAIETEWAWTSSYSQCPEQSLNCTMEIYSLFTLMQPPKQSLADLNPQQFARYSSVHLKLTLDNSRWSHLSILVSRVPFWGGFVRLYTILEPSQYTEFHWPCCLSKDTSSVHFQEFHPKTITRLPKGIAITTNNK